jgi:hypothetical protein
MHTIYSSLADLLNNLSFEPAVQALDEFYKSELTIADEWAIRAVDDATKRRDFLNNLDSTQCRQIAEMIATLNEKIKRSGNLPLIGAHVALDFSRRSDTTIEDVSAICAEHLAFTINNVEFTSESFGTSALAILKSTDRQFASLAFLAVYCNAGKAETLVGTLTTESLAYLTQYSQYAEEILGPKSVSFYTLLISALDECLKRPEAPQKRLWYTSRIAYFLCKIANDEPAKVFDTERRQRALRLYLDGLDDLKTLDAANRNFVISNAKQLSVQLLRANPTRHNRDCALEVGFAALRENVDSGTEIMNSIADALEEVSDTGQSAFRDDETSGGRLRGVSSQDLSDLQTRATVILPDVVLAGAKFFACVHIHRTERNDIVSGAEPDQLQVQIEAKGSTQVVNGTAEEIRRFGPSLFVADLTPDRWSYTDTLYIRVLRNGMQIGGMEVEIDCRNEEATSVLGKTISYGLPKSEPVSADLVLEATLMNNRFRLQASISRLAIVSLTLVDVQTQVDPGVLIEAALGEIRGIYAEATESTVEAASESVGNIIDRLGNELFHALVPVDLAEIMSANIADIRSICIRTNVPSIPWEILPIWIEGQRKVWSEIFDLSLMPYISSLPQTWKFEELNLAIRDVNTAEQRHRESADNGQFRLDSQIAEASLRGRVTQIRAHKLTGPNIRNSWEKASSGLWYFAAHGETGAGLSNLRIESDGAVPLMLADFCGPDSAPHRSFMFLNLCNSTTTEQALFSLVSWPERLIEAGATGYLGARWPVTEKSAVIFAEKFFRFVADGSTIPTAVREARDSTRREVGSGDPSWMSYSLYCHPALTPQFSR